jgi:hypothetical protein
VIAPRRDDGLGYPRGPRSLHRPARLGDVIDVHGDPGAVVERATGHDIVDKLSVLAIEEFEGGGRALRRLLDPFYHLTCDCRGKA